jgi:transposase
MAAAYRRHDLSDAAWALLEPHLPGRPGALGGNQDTGPTKGPGTKVHLAVDAHGLPRRVVFTAGPQADCSRVRRLIEAIAAEHLLADKGYDSDAINEQAKLQGIDPVIRLHHLIENAFLHLKRGRCIATRYAKNASSYMAPV